jgi:hypothetical protein
VIGYSPGADDLPKADARRHRADPASGARSAYFLKLEKPRGAELIGAPMAELFVMCPDCGLNAKLAPGEPPIKDEEGLCKHRQNPMACPTLGPILDAMRRRKAH